jgi:hypothetical protein
MIPSGWGIEELCRLDRCKEGKALLQLHAERMTRWLDRHASTFRAPNVSVVSSWRWEFRERDEAYAAALSESLSIHV